jgi:tetratricopeptide (TPR) repeat protein
VTGWEALHLDDLDAIPVAGVVWHPVRRRLGIRAFGVNAYTAERVGSHVIEEHDETGSGARGHEELYLVVSGRASFTIGGERLDAPAGTMVFLRDPALRRAAIAEEEGTLVLAVGGEPGRPFEASPWESYFTAAPLLDAGRFEEAIAAIEEGLRAHPGNPSVLYNLACAEARAGRRDDALSHLREATAVDAGLAARAREDPDFASIRDTPGFPG